MQTAMFTWLPCKDNINDGPTESVTLIIVGEWPDRIIPAALVS